MFLPGLDRSPDSLLTSCLKDIRFSDQEFSEGLKKFFEVFHNYLPLHFMSYKILY